MRWPAAWMFAAVWAAGCHSTPPAFDPFLPNTRIPPPPTGAATGSGDANYLNPAPFTGSVPAYPPPAAVPGGNGTSNPYTPPGGYQYQPSPAPASTPTPAAGGGFGSTPGPAPSKSLQFVPAVGGSRNRGAVLASYNAASTGEDAQGGQEQSESAGRGSGSPTSAPDSANVYSGRTQRQAVRANHVAVVNDEPSPVYERAAAKHPSRAGTARTPSSSDPIDLMDLPPVARSTR
ncbi:MAG TPA: hypothetical protein VNH11_32850 [Pirellulales bacterium]|nr:hypothetical protein [Pirellulales bacterium]